MWLISGPFDDEYDDGPPPTKTKLLKTGKEYPVGRKDQPLSIKNKAISKGSHVVFIVGECTEEQAADPTFVPTLSLYNPTERGRTIERPTIEAPRIKCGPHTSTFLHSEDVVHMSQFVYVRVRWEPICCYSGSARAGPSISLKDCADLGIHVLPTLHASITHHLTPTYSLTPALATSLVALSTFVKPEWLVAVLAAGRAESGELSTLEETFVLPPTSKFRPTFAPALPPRLKKFDIWQPNEERVGLFRGHRFVFAGEKGAEAPGVLKELVRSADGEYECFAVENGPGRFRQVLSKGKARGSTLVLIADQYAVVAAVGEDAWRALKEEARSFELKFLAPEVILEAVVYTDVSYIASSSTAEEPIQQSVLPDVIPNSIEDEPSIAPPTAARQREPSPVQEASQEEAPRRKLPRRAVSRASSRAPSPPPVPAPDNAGHARESEPPESSQPRRTLVRRAVRPKTIDDTTTDIDTSIIGRASEEPAARPNPINPPTPGRPSRLKRRVGTQAQSTASGSQPIPDSADVLIPDAPEPPHKKFKALFDASEGLSLADYGSQRADESPTQYEPSMLPPSGTRTTGTRSGERSGVPLTALMEEEEESTLATSALPTQAQARGTKRKSQPGDGDVDMEDVPPRTRRRTEDEPAQSTQAPQSRAETQTTSRSKPVSQVVTRVDMAQEQVHVKEKPLSKKPSAATGAGAPPGEPDKDAAFLKAVASKKRGKKTEDTFDREFNNLRISKPDLDRAKETESDRWGVLEEFGDDGDVRGNFMVVMEMPIFREGGNGAGDHLRRGDGRLEWQGRPDFKKFKRKNMGQERQPVELVVEEESDLGIGSQYWKGGSQAPPTSQSYSRAHSQQPKAEESEHEKSTTQRSTQRGTKGRPRLVADDDDDDSDEGSTRTALSKPASKKSQPKRSQPSRAASSQRSTKGTQKQPLFIDSDIEELDEKAGAGEFGSDLDVDMPGSDDDEGEPATLRSTATRGGTTQGSATAARAKKRAATVVDDDSDDGATFKAFGARTRPRRR